MPERASDERERIGRATGLVRAAAWSETSETAPFPANPQAEKLWRMNLEPTAIAMLLEGAKNTDGVVSVKVAKQAPIHFPKDRRLATAEALEQMGLLQPVPSSDLNAKWQLTSSAREMIWASGLR